MSRERMTDEALRAMLEAATPGPWHMEHASKAPPGEEWGEVVARLHPAGGAGAPVPGMRLTWSRRSVGVLAERNARLISAAPDLAREALELRAELAQARAEVASMNEWLDHQGAPQAQPDSWLFGRFAALLHQHEEESRLLQERATAQLRAELAKPVVGRWRRQHDPDWSARCAIEPFHRHQYAVEVGPNGWWVRAPDPGGEGSGERCASGPETGEAGRRLADEAAIAAGWRLL